VARHLHGHALGDAGSHQVAYGRPSQVVGIRPGQPAFVQAALNVLRNVVIRFPFTFRFDRLNTHGQITSSAFRWDVFANMLVRRYSNLGDAEGVLRVEGAVLQCNGSGCRLIGFQEFGTANVGDKVTLLVRWEPEFDRFVFRRDNLAEETISYDVPDEGVPANGPKWIDVSTTVANCTSQPRPVASMETAFDDVVIADAPR
jgi:hypothetical protein